MTLKKGITEKDGNFKIIARMQAADLVAESLVFVDGAGYKIKTTNLGSGILLSNGNYANLVAGWLNKSSAFNIESGEKYQIDGSGGSVDAVLSTSYLVGSVIIVHNESISTNTVRLTNTALTIKGVGGTVTNSDNLVLEPGDTAHLVAKTTTILEVI